MGLCIAKEAWLKQLMVSGDSMLVISAMVTHAKPGSNAMSSLLSRIKN